MRKLLSFFSSLALLAQSFVPFVFSARPALANGGAIWTTKDDCGSEQQDVNHYSVGDHVFINGSGFDQTTSYNWDITGKPGGASCDPSQAVATGSQQTDESGAFCFEAYTVAEGDCGEYGVNFGDKNDNYRVGEELLGSITIVKDSQPDDTQDFTFTTTGAGLSNFSLDDDQDPTLPNNQPFPGLSAGIYTVTEGNTDGWALDSITCLDPTQNSGGSELTATIDLAAGEAVTCTFVNIKGPVSVCGNEQLEQGEQCDDGSQNGQKCTPAYEQSCQYCDTSCQTQIVWGHYCGDGLLDTNDGEQCDDGNTNDGDGCSANCQVEAPPSAPFCGDGEVNQDIEECDWNGEDGSVCEPPYGGNCQYCSDACRLITVDGPYCGDGIKNGEEECDGRDGVTPGQNFCTQICHLVPIYDGSHTCPEGTARSAQPVATYTINGKDVDGETFGLTAGGKYLFEASGTFIPTSALGYLSDAGYTWVNGLLSTMYGIHGTPPDYAAHALLADLGSGVGVVDWGDTNPDHIYSKYYEPTTSSVQFLIGDRYSDWFNTLWQNQAGMGDNEGSLTLNIYECQEYGRIEGYKWNDLNGDHERDEGEDPMNKWEIFIDENRNYQLDEGEESVITDDSGNYWFSHLEPGHYTVCEVLKEGWEQTFPSGGTGCHEVNVESGTYSRDNNFGNREVAPVLTITKSNDTGGADRNPGDAVLYTIAVSLADADLNDVQVTDVLSDGFTYRSGSWTANSSDTTRGVGGDLRAGGITTDPLYTSPGIWKLGDMTAGEVVTLTYIADISTSQEPGLYKDLAWGEGCREGEREGCDRVLALAIDPGKVDTNFVGTEVNVIGGAPTTTTIKITEKEETNEVLGEVLGASTLPATGANPVWLLIAGLSGLLGAFLVALGFKKKKIVAALFLGFAVFALSAGKASAAVSPNLSVRLEEPKSPTNDGSFNLEFVALDTEGRTVTAKCYDGIYQFGPDIPLPAGGGAGHCAVTLSSQGPYEFRVTAEVAGFDPTVSAPVWVTLDTTPPANPENFSKDKLDSCGYRISFRTGADSGDTVRAEIYRSDLMQFEANADTRIASLAVSSDQNVSHLDTVSDCGRTYFYAVRAFDAAGNGSEARGDSEVVRVTTVTVTPAGGVAGSGSSSQGGAIPVSESGVAAPESGTGGEAAGEEGGVLGEEATPGAGEAAQGGEFALPETPAKPSRVLLYLLGGAFVVGLIYYAFFRPKKK